MRLKRQTIGARLFKGITVLVVWALVQATGPALVAEFAGRHNEPAVEMLDASLPSASDMAKRPVHQATPPAAGSAGVDRPRPARCRLGGSLQPPALSGSVPALKGRDPPQL